MVFRRESLAVGLERGVLLEPLAPFLASVRELVGGDARINITEEEVGGGHFGADEPAALLKARLNNLHDVREARVEQLLDSLVLALGIGRDERVDEVQEDITVEVSQHVTLVLLLQVERVVTVSHAEVAHDSVGLIEDAAVLMELNGRQRLILLLQRGPILLLDCLVLVVRASMLE